MNPTFGSLFAGVGGFDLGFEAAGYDCKFQVEWDKHCQQVLAYHWPDVPRWGDVSEVNGADLPPVDVITYGFPCQDLSVAGKRAGLNGDRSNLFFQAIRIITEMRESNDHVAPAFAVAENVPGLLTADGGYAMARCLDTLADAGAVEIKWCVLDARHFRVPQRRRRIFLVAVFNTDVAERCPEPLFPVSTRNVGDMGEVESDGGWMFYRTHGKNDQAQYGISPPLKSITPVCIANGASPPRRLTPVEHERLMGWPDNHTLYRADGKRNSDTQRYKECGNGVVAPVAEWIAQQLKGTL